MASCDAFDLARYPTSFSLRRGDLIQPLRDWSTPGAAASGRAPAACSWPSVPIDWARYEETRRLHGFRVAHRVVQAASIIPNLVDDLVAQAVAHGPPSVFGAPLTSLIEPVTSFLSMAELSLRIAATLTALGSKPLASGIGC